MIKKLSIFLFLFLVSGCSNEEMMALDDAQSKALEEINGDVRSFVENLDDETPHYIFTIHQEGQNYDVKVDASDGSIISKNLSEQQDEMEEEDAKSLALEQFENATISNITYQEEDKTFMATVSDGVYYYEVTIDATNKEVTKVKQISTE